MIPGPLKCYCGIHGFQLGDSIWANGPPAKIKPLLLPALGVSLFSVPLFLPTLFETGTGIRTPFPKPSPALGLIWSVGWLLIRLAALAETWIFDRYSMDVSDNLRARKIHTQLTLLRKIAVFTIIGISFASSLMVFDRVRQLGASILASAGIAGIIIGIAAQKMIANILAGLQVAITQPIRLDDVVIIDNEWGRIEEITMTYVVVRIWDERRLIVPINRFIDQAFQNWTRSSSRLLGSVLLYLDHSIPMAGLRKELDRILAESDLWDGRVKTIQLVDTTEKCIVVRALVSAKNSSAAWDLRCLVRERLVDFVRTEYPLALPRLRTEIKTEDSGATEKA